MRSCVRAVTLRRRSPTHRLSAKKNGTVTTAMAVSCHDSATMATSAERKVTTLYRTELRVEVSTPCTPPTSLVSRLWISPVRVPVKKARGSRCRWSNSFTRSWRSTCWPTTLVSHVWARPRSAPVTAKPTINMARNHTRPSRGPPGANRPVSNTRLMSSGFTTPTAAPASTSTMVRATVRRCGANSGTMRRHVPGPALVRAMAADATAASARMRHRAANGGGH